MSAPVAAVHPALRPWLDLLGDVAPDLAGSLLPWLPRLAALLGADRPADPTRRGEPDGFTGFTRRGPPERLALSEWALHDVHPDEFLRRATAGEQLFLDPAWREPRAARRALVLFDAGPDQLGACRLAHLALFAVLVRRARDAGGVLTWATLGEGALIRTARLPDDLAALAGARSWEVGPWDPAPWRERIAAIDDVWVVGGDDAVALAGDIGAVALRVDEEAGAVVVRRGARGRTVRLPLADRDVGASALRAPLAPVAPPPRPQTSARHSGWFTARPDTLLFSPSGGHLIFQLQSGGVGAVPIGPGARKRFRPRTVGLREGETAIAATVRRKQLQVLALSEPGVRLVSDTGQGGFLSTPVDGWPTAPIAGLELAVLEGDGPQRLIYRSQDRLHWTDGGAADRLVPLGGRDVVAFARGPSGPRALSCGETGVHLADWQSGPEAPIAPTWYDAFGFSAWEGFLGPLQLHPSATSAPASALAVLGPDGWWGRRLGLWQHERGEPVPLGSPGPEERVIGVLVSPHLDLGLDLALLVVQGRRLVAWSRDRQRPLFRAQVPVVNAAASPAVPRVALALADGRIVVLDLATGDVALELAPGRDR